MADDPKLPVVAVAQQPSEPSPNLTAPNIASSFGPVPVMNDGMTFREVGNSGLRAFAGYVREEFLPQLQGRQAMTVYREMADNSPIIGAIIFAIQATMKKVEWRTVPANDTPAAEEAAEFADSLRLDMSATWEDTVSEVLSMLTYGFAPLEIVYKKRLGYDPGPDPKRPGRNLPKSKFDDGKVGWRRLPLRGQDTVIKWFFDENGETEGMTQQPWTGPLIDIPIQKMLLFRPSQHKNNPEGRSLLRNAYRCFSDDTDLLTRSGWKNVADITSADEMATLNHATGELEYQPPNSVYKFPYRGKMLHQAGRFVDQLVTPNHRMYVRRDGAKQFEWIEAADMKKSVYFKRDAIWHGQERDTYALEAWAREQGVRGGGSTMRVHHPAREIPMDAWLRFLGIYLAEGCTYRNKAGQRFVYISQNEGERLDQIVQWVEACGFPYRIKADRTSAKRTIEITSAQLYDELEPMGNSHSKYIPRDLLELSQRQLRVLFDAMWLGDGSMNGNAQTYATVSKRLADDVAELLFKIGYAPSIRWQKSTGIGYGCWQVTAVTPRADGNRANLIKDQRSWVDYDGDVFCVEVPNSTVYCRRHGKSSWSGNSYYLTKRIEEQEAILFERMNGLPVIRVPGTLMETARGTGPEAAAALQALNTFKAIAVNLRVDEQMGLVLPSDVFEGPNGPTSVRQYELELIAPGGNGGRSSTQGDPTIIRHQNNMLMSVLADFLSLGHGQTGTQALSVSKQDMFFQAVEGYLNSSAAVFNRHGLPRAWELNGMDPDLLPEFTPDLAQNVDLDMLGNFVNRLAASGMALFPNGDLEGALMDAAGLPDIADPAMREQLEADGEDGPVAIAGPMAAIAVNDAIPQPGMPGGPPLPEQAPPGKKSNFEKMLWGSVARRIQKRGPSMSINTKRPLPIKR